jgi:hypothetical protein
MSGEDRVDTAPADAEGRPARKPYEAPQLLEYGDIAVVTQTLSMDGMPDGGVGKTKGTEP